MTSDAPEEVEEERRAVVSEERTRRRGLLLEAKALLVQGVAQTKRGAPPLLRTGIAGGYRIPVTSN